MRRLMNAASLSLLVAITTGCQSRTEVILTLDVPYTEGEVVYSSACASCHGEMGEGTDLGLDLVRTIPMHRDYELVSSMLHGLDPDMPSFEYLTDEELAGLVRFLRFEFGEYDPTIEHSH